MRYDAEGTVYGTYRTRGGNDTVKNVKNGYNSFASTGAGWLQDIPYICERGLHKTNGEQQDRAPLAFFCGPGNDKTCVIRSDGYSWINLLLRASKHIRSFYKVCKLSLHRKDLDPITSSSTSGRGEAYVRIVRYAGRGGVPKPPPGLGAGAAWNNPFQTKLELRTLLLDHSHPPNTVDEKVNLLASRVKSFRRLATAVASPNPWTQVKELATSANVILLNPTNKMPVGVTFYNNTTHGRSTWERTTQSQTHINGQSIQTTSQSIRRIGWLPTERSWSWEQWTKSSRIAAQW